MLVGFLERPSGGGSVDDARVCTPRRAVLTVASAVSSLLDAGVYRVPRYAIDRRMDRSTRVSSLFAAFLLPVAGADFGALATMLIIAILPSLRSAC